MTGQQARVSLDAWVLTGVAALCEQTGQPDLAEGVRSPRRQWELRERQLLARRKTSANLS